MILEKITKVMTPSQLESARNFIDESGLKVKYRTRAFTSKKIIVDIIFDQMFSKTMCNVMAYLYNQKTK